jgi:hypothetical protein
LNKRLILASAVLLFAGCGGGGSTSTTPQPTVQTSASESVSFATTASTLALPALPNAPSGSVTLAAATSATTGTLTFETTLPAGVSVASSKLRAPASIGGTNLQTLGYVAFIASAPVSFSTTFGFSFTFATVPTGSTYIAFYDFNQSANGWNIVSGPSVASGNTITFAPQPLTPPTTFVPGDTYFYALVESSKPITATTTASYAGTKSVNYTYGYAFGYPSPAPNATAPPATLNYTVATAVSVGQTPFPGTAPSGSAPVDEHVSETDSQSLSASTFTTDEWATVGSTTGSDTLSVLGLVQQEPTSATVPVDQIIYGTPQLIDEYPETNGASWTNVPTATETYSFDSGADTGTRATASDGTYTDTETLLQGAGGQAVLTENSDGSGSIVGPYYGGGIVTSVTMSAPASGMIADTTNYTAFAQAQYGFPPSQTIEDPVWWTTPAPPVFYTETDGVATGQALPAGCSTAYGTSGTQVQRAITVLDTVIGDLETTTLDSYDVGGVPVCLVSSDVLNYAYDQQGNTPYFIIFGQLGLEVVTTSETLSLQAGATSALPASTHRPSASVATGVGVSASMTLAALENHELTAFHKARIVQEHAFLKRLHTLTAANAKIVLGGHQ